MVTAASVTIAAIYYMFTLRINMKTQQLTLQTQKQNLETRQSQILMSIYQSMSTPEYQRAWYETVTLWHWTDFDDFMKKYSPVGDLDEWTKRSFVGCQMNGLGVLVKNGLIDARMVDDLMPFFVIGYWEKFADITRETRARFNQPIAEEYTEYLYNEVKKIYDKKHEGGKPVFDPIKLGLNIGNLSTQ